jgi:hypothetical protein
VRTHLGDPLLEVTGRDQIAAGLDCAGAEDTIKLGSGSSPPAATTRRSAWSVGLGRGPGSGFNTIRLRESGVVWSTPAHAAGGPDVICVGVCMAVALDSAGPIPGYFDSPWPAECGGPRRQRVPRSAGLGVGEATGLRQHSRTNDQWNVLAVLRAPGELYLLYTNYLAGPDTYTRVELIDAASLETVRRSPPLSTGGHTWCTALAAHENGYLYLTSGNRCFKLDPDCAVVAETRLPRDSAYNGLLIAADGRLIAKNVERDPRPADDTGRARPGPAGAGRAAHHNGHHQQAIVHYQQALPLLADLGYATTRGYATFTQAPRLRGPDR